MLVLIISNANSGVNRRTKDKIISLSLLSVVLFLSRFFFLRVVRTRSERVRDGSLHFSPLEQQRKEF